MASAAKDLERWLQDVGKQLESPPMNNLTELVALLDLTERFLTRVQQSPTKSILDSLRPTIKLLAQKKFLEHPDEDVKAIVTSCINEILRITAPNAPYDDDIMKVVFQNIVHAFNKLDEMSSDSFYRSAMILETVSKVRSCIVMLDLECDDLVLEMFRIFLRTIRPDHSENVFFSMQDIMTAMLKESDDISPELISCLLDAVKIDNKNILPIVRRLGERVISNCALTLKPYLTKLSQSENAFLSKHSKVVASVCEGNSDCTKPEKINSAANDMGNEPNGETVNISSRNPVESSDTTRSKNGQPRSAKLSTNKPGGSAKVQLEETDGIGKLASATNSSGMKGEKLTGRKAKAIPGGSSEQKQITIKHHKNLGKGLPVETSMKNSERSAQVRELDDRIVGARIKVWWPDDEKFYDGVVAEYDRSTKKHKIDYDDGDVEILLLKKEHWEFIDEPKSCYLAGKAKVAPNLDASLKEEHAKKENKSSNNAVKEKETNSETPIQSAGRTELPKRKGRPPKGGISNHSSGNKSKDGMPKTETMIRKGDKKLMLDTVKVEEKSSRSDDNKSKDGMPKTETMIGKGDKKLMLATIKVEEHESLETDDKAKDESKTNGIPVEGKRKIVELEPSSGEDKMALPKDSVSKEPILKKPKI
ncbi:hypothetical protein Cni_G28180 [Canna indica]|uniref:Uncharacterized protein n=1 Tax=Canna indica TaxID=4628 RepID=A0AAQ3L939_9LILI|nr:hypothetical protein Cni_G28180 [Canna indica]